MKHDGPSRAEWIKHRSQQAIVVGGIGGILADLAYALIGPWDTLFTVIGAVFMAVFITGVVYGISHDEAECLVCMDRFPIEHAEDLATRHAGSLRGAHLLMTFHAAVARIVPAVCTLVRRKQVHVPVRLSIIIGTVAWVGTFLVIGTFFVPRPWAGIVFMTFIVWQVVVVGRHQRLQPWCRWCRGDDGGDDNDKVPDPDPAPGKSINV